MRTCLRGMNEKLVTAVESKNDKFEEATVGVEAEPELPCGVVVTYICVKNAVFGSMNAGFCADAVLQCGRMRSHYAASSQARTAARIASERLTCSRSAREANAFKRVASMRTGITSPGPSPIGRRPLLRSCPTGYPCSASFDQASITSSETGTPSTVSFSISISYYAISRIDTPKSPPDDHRSPFQVLTRARSSPDFDREGSPQAERCADGSWIE